MLNSIKFICLYKIYYLKDSIDDICTDFHCNGTHDTCKI